MGISVIVVVRNGEPFLAEALQSIADQSHPPTEVLVVDGGSTDQSVAIAQRFERVRLIHQSGAGLAAARNQGIQAAVGEWIAFLDADDRWAAEKLAHQCAYLAAHPTCASVTGHMIRFAQPGCAIPAQYEAGWLQQPTPALTPGGLLVRRSIFDYYGYFDPAFTIGCDSDWLARLQDAGCPPALLPLVVLHKRIHAANLSSNMALARRELLALTRRSLTRRQRFQAPNP
ncbi:MAG: glycosyltransferase [Caldilineaceae bacterium]|nr:glycosyltransferase [Caldilineaceae bacterium]